MGVKSEIFRADLREPADIHRLAADVERRFSRLDVLVNSAAAFERRKIEDMDPGSWDAMLALNLRAPALLSRAAVPVMKRGGGGVIINIADVAGFRPWANHLHYSVSKAGLLHMTACLAMELAPNIRVNAVAPGTVLPAAFQSEKELAATLERTPLKTPGTAEDVGGAVVFLAGARAVTGQVIAVDGGRALNTAGNEQWKM
jgi:pteridine reductase